MKINFFKKDSALYPLRWFIMICVLSLGIMVYADITGWRLLSSSSSGKHEPGAVRTLYHK